MVFHAIAVWLLVASLPLWAYRWFLYAKLDERERQIFKRLVTKRYEGAFAFGARMFGFLVALAASVLLLVYSLRYFKHGSLELGVYKETVRTRLYSGMEPVDQALNTFHYEQPLPVAILTTCFLLSVVFTLVATALRDVATILRLRKKLERIQSGRSDAQAT
ncbi:hypothetical protein [Labrenzia sp. VG12]|uniref:hypothetical protein n=1 Tax=Labrenzia sp. VG12 TaxID=2021862 RepID=UPI000B8C4910|nr:hypothetical protein [Labrenzia sp. VG12]ASP33927.1 hypothetical protein CHH27_12305 [Labrenzia sp. VG12]